MMHSNEHFIQAMAQQQVREREQISLVSEARRLAAAERGAAIRQPRRRVRVPGVVSRALGWQPA